MPLPDIKLDDRTFEQLVAEAKRRIPGYTPEWTDLNESDPGITLVQLFAWLSEMIIWRLNRVPEKNFIKFLELIGIEPTPPSPAHAELTFKLSTKNITQFIPQGTRVALAEQVDGAQIIFETDDNLYAAGSELAAVQSFDGARFEIVPEASRLPGKFFYPFGPRPQRDSALYLGFDTQFVKGNPVTLTIHVYTADLIAEGKGIRAYFRKTTSQPGNGNGELNAVQPDENTPPPSAIVIWEYFAGKDANPSWQPLRNVRDNTGNLTKTGTVVFDPPENPAPVAEKLGLLRKDEDVPLFWIRYRIVELLGPGFERAPRVEDVLLNTIGATNSITVTNELLGASDATPNQKFKLANAPVLRERFELQVDEGEGLKSWTMVRDFAASKPEDRHFTLATTTGEIAFGNGEQGRIPGRLPLPEEPERDQPNIRVVNYRAGGGAGGNAGANKITSLETSLPFVESVTNLRSAIGGQDEEPVEQTKLRAPESIRTQSRAVTASDFEFLATQTPGARIKRAHALPLRHPDFEPIRPTYSEAKPECSCPKCAGAAGGAQQSCGCSGGMSDKTSCDAIPARRLSSSALIPVPGVITIMVVPEALPDEVKPLPSEDTLRLVGQWLNRHRLITTELYVAAPKYREVEIEARVIAQPTANSGRVAEGLEKMLLDYFHPLRGGDSGKGWDFGRAVSFAEVYRRILNTPGVARLEAGAVITYVDGERQPPCTDVFVNDDELVFSRKHKIIVSYA